MTTTSDHVLDDDLVTPEATLGGDIQSRKEQIALAAFILVPFLAVLAGWFVTEIGRAPWLVYGMMTQAESLTPSLTGGMALFTLIGYIVVYGLVFTAGVYYLMRVLYVGMEDEGDGREHEAERPSRPFSAAHVPFEIDDDNRPGSPTSQGGY